MKLRTVAMLALSGLAVSASAAPAKPDFCKSFKRVIAAASEKPPFSSISGPIIDQSERKTTINLPGFVNCRIDSYRYDNPGYYCTISGLAAPQAKVQMGEFKGKIEACMGKAMERDWERSTQPWVIHAGSSAYPMAWTNVLRNGDVAVGFVSSYRQPR